MAFTVDQAFGLMEGAYERERLAHAFLISGPSGCGKETLAARVITRLQAKGAGTDLFGEAVTPEVRPLDELNGEWVQVLRPKSKSRRISVDDVRGFEKRLYQVAGEGTWKVGVIADCDRMTAASENAFLKTLEEPPPRTLLLLLTDNPGGLLPTVISRCVRMPLMGKPDLTGSGGGELVEALNAAAGGFGALETALGLKARFAGILAERKQATEKAADEAFKDEEKALRNAVEGDWLKRREEEFKAAAAADYLNDRARLFAVLECWLGDVLRVKTGAGGLDFPENEARVREVAEGEELPGLLRRMEAVDELRRTLDTNAQEQLALEVGFLKAFG